MRSILIYNQSGIEKELVGELKEIHKDSYEFTYSKEWLKLPYGVDIDNELPVDKGVLTFKELPAFFKARIPEETNSFREKLLIEFGLSPKETDPLKLLATVGRKGGSTLILEASGFNPKNA